MHIAIVTTELATATHSSGGLASFSANLARIFRQHGHEVTIVLVTTKEEQLEFDKDILLENIYVEKALWNRFDNMAQIISSVIGEKRDEIRKLIVNIYKSEQVNELITRINRDREIDIIHLCNISALSVRLDNKIPYTVRMSCIESIWDDADLPDAGIHCEENVCSIKNRLQNYMLKNTRYIISPSNFVAKSVYEITGKNPAVIESPYIMDKREWDYSVYRAFCKKRKYIIHYGTLSYRKGTHVVAQIINSLLKKYTNITMVLAGNSTEMIDMGGKKIKAHELVRQNAGEHADRVIYVGRLVREQLYPLILDAELCLFPSRVENLSNACIEAMALGKVVVATEGVSFEQLIEDRVSGFLCKKDDSDSLLQAIFDALDMCDQDRNKMKEKAAMRIKELAPDKVYSKYLAFYHKVIQEWESRE